MKMRAKKIFISGDSAGGNLTFALTNLIIQTGVRRPDKIFPNYPACFISMKKMMPSYLLSLDDPILPAAFLAMCVDKYQGDQNSDDFYYMCVGKTPDKILKEYPPVMI